MPFVGHPRLKFRAGRSHDNVALVQIRIRIDENVYTTPAGKPVGVRDRIRTPIDDNFDPRGGKPVEVRVRIRIRIDDDFDTQGGEGPVRVRVQDRNRIDDSDFGARLLLCVHRVDF